MEGKYVWHFNMNIKLEISQHIKYVNKTKDWALVQNAAFAGGVKVELGLFK